MSVDHSPTYHLSPIWNEKRPSRAGIEAGIPTEVASGCVGEFFRREWNPSSVGGHTHFAFLRSPNGAHEAGGGLASGKAEGTKTSEQSLGFPAGRSWATVLHGADINIRPTGSAGCSKSRPDLNRA